MNRRKSRQVLDCASPLALLRLARTRESGRRLPQSKTLLRRAVVTEGSWSQCAIKESWRLSMNPVAGAVKRQQMSRLVNQPPRHRGNYNS